FGTPGCRTVDFGPGRVHPGRLDRPALPDRRPDFVGPRLRTTRLTRPRRVVTHRATVAGTTLQAGGSARGSGRPGHGRARRSHVLRAAGFEPVAQPARIAETGIGAVRIEQHHDHRAAVDKGLHHEAAPRFRDVAGFLDTDIPARLHEAVRVAVANLAIAGV